MGGVNNGGSASQQFIADADHLGDILPGASPEKNPLMDEAGSAGRETWASAQKVNAPSLAALNALPQMAILKNDGPTAAAADARFDALVAKNVG